MPLYTSLRISHIIPETPGVKTFVLDTGGEPLRYEAGQYLTFVFKNNDREIRRSYSFSSSPVLNEPPAITVKRVENGEISRPLIDRAAVGDELLTTGAAGFFVLPPVLKKDQQLFFLAAGSGIVPVYSLIKTVLHTHPGVEVVLIYSNRSQADTIWYRELDALQEKFRHNFRLEFLFSLSPDLLRARLNQSLLRTLISRHAIASTSDILFYLCGPFAYMRMIEFELHTMGFPAAQIRKEQFSTLRPASKPQPPDTNPHDVTLHINNQVHHITVQYPHTILETAKQHGISLPYSCEAGKCGSCAATCVQGKVWMMYNEVLMDDELEKGLVLTCSGFPVGGDAVLEWRGGS